MAHSDLGAFFGLQGAGTCRGFRRHSNRPDVRTAASRGGRGGGAAAAPAAVGAGAAASSAVGRDHSLHDAHSSRRPAPAGPAGIVGGSGPFYRLPESDAGDTAVY